MIRLGQLEPHSLTVLLILRHDPILCQNSFSHLCLSTQLRALRDWEVETLQRITPNHVSFKQLLIFVLVLVRHDGLPRHLSIAMQLLRHRRVVLMLATPRIAARQALRLLYFHSESCIEFHTRVFNLKLALTIGLHSCHTLDEAGWNLADGVHNNRITACVVYQILPTRVVIGPEALSGLDLHDVSTFFTIVFTVL